MMSVERLRFKDGNGNNYPDWKFTKLSKIGYFKTSSVDKKNIPTEQEVFLVNYMDVYNHLSLSNKAKNNLMKVTAKASQLKENNLLRGDILFTPSSETPDDIGHSVVVYEDLINTVYSYHLVRYRTTIQLDLNYAHYFCNTQDLLKQMSILSQGATRFTLSLKSFNSLKTKISQDIKEQEKIGNFLLLFDRLIEKLEAKIGLLKELKKGYLQQMFPAKGEKVPKIRFKGFDVDWEFKRIGEISNVLTGSTPSTSVNEYYENGIYPWITPTDINNSTFISDSSKKLTNKGLKKARELPTNSVLVTCIASIGKNAILKCKGSCNQQINAILPSSEYEPIFIYNLITYNSKRLESIGGNGGMVIINKREFMNFKIQMTNVFEQKKIGNVFKSIDEMIEKHEKKMNETEQLKKGYMQRLFA